MPVVADVVVGGGQRLSRFWATLGSMPSGWEKHPEYGGDGGPPLLMWTAVAVMLAIVFGGGYFLTYHP